MPFSPITSWERRGEVAMAGLDDVDMNDFVQAEGRADRQSKVDIGAGAKVVTRRAASRRGGNSQFANGWGERCMIAF